MGLFGLGETAPVKKQKYATEMSVDFYHRNQCKVCSLNTIPSNLHPHIKPSGTSTPEVYILGEAPGAEEDEKGIPFVGRTGGMLRKLIQQAHPNWYSKLRWSNVVRTRPPKNRDPHPEEIECCRPSVAGDIQQSRPKAIFGFGNVPLQWALKREGITLWNGRKVPVRIGAHNCWFFPMLHPSYVMRMQDDENNHDAHFVFSLNIHSAFSQIDTLPEPLVHTESDARNNVEIITGQSSDDISKVLSFIKSLYDQKTVGLDYETKMLRPYSTGARILTLALSSAERTLAFPLSHAESGFTDQQAKRINDEYKGFLYNAKCRKLAHNLAFEMEWTAYFFGENSLRAGLWGDSLSQSYIIDERPKTHDLDFLVMQYFGFNLKQLSNLDKNRLDREPLESVLRYNGMDAKYHRLLYLEQRKELKRQGLVDLYQHQLRRIPTMVLTQMKGVPVDQSVVKRFNKQYMSQLNEIENEIHLLPQVVKFKEKHSKPFRPSAPKDIIKLLEDEGNHGVRKSDEETLSKLNHPVAKLVLKWRDTNKLLSTYVRPLLKYDDASCLHPDNLLHPIVSTTTTRTWRTSSKDPNSQNFAKHDHREVRSQVKHVENKIVTFDYAGIQARNVAMESRDKALVKAFWNDYDVHGFWAKRAAKVYPRWVTEGLKSFNTDKDVFKKYRQLSKNLFVFPSFFGAQPKSISANIGLPEAIAEQLQDEFWNEFPDIHRWQKRIASDYRNTGYVTGLSGFRRHAPISQNQIINSPIQADESIIVCSAMAALSEMEDERYQANMEIHDDLTFIWPKNEIEKNAEVVAREMTRLTFPWMGIVPIVVEMSIGDDWSSVKEVAKFSSIEIWGHKV
jgi:uracil-DNA glycosylase family 4